MPRIEVTGKLCNYIKKHKLKDAKVRTQINADARLKPVFNGKGRFRCSSSPGSSPVTSKLGRESNNDIEVTASQANRSEEVIHLLDVTRP